MFLDALFTDLIVFLTGPLSLYLKASKLATFIFYVKDVYLHMIEEKRTDESNPSQYLRRTLSNSNKDLCIILCLLDDQSSNRLISI